MAAPNFANRTLYHGDNLAFLRGMNSESVHPIATDPPFNKGKDFHATPDSLAAGAKFQDRWSWADDVEQAWVDQIEDDWPAVHAVIEASKTTYGQDMAAFLCFMGVRLLEMHRVLREDGSIYLHCDPTASHYLKQLMDAVFGKRFFQNELIWHYKSFHGQVRRYYPRKHDVLLLYTKTGAWTFNQQFEESNEDTIDVRRWKDYLVDGYKILGSNMPMQDTRFVRYYNRWTREHGQAPGPSDVVYEVKGQAFDTVWDIKPVDPKDKKERLGYPTQKPLALYERIISASSNPGDLVLDPFCGCATTPVAAERLGRQWIGMDIWDGALTIVKQRMEDNRQLLTEADPQIHYETAPPERTDGGLEAAPFIQVTERYAEPDGPHMSRAEMYAYLLAQRGQRCQGCDRVFDDARYLELDHNTPRSDGGLNHITNRVLLCSPCNRAKSNTYTLPGLRRLNRANGWMAT